MATMRHGETRARFFGVRIGAFLLALAACSSPTSEQADASAVQEAVDSIPLKPGYYVAADTPCGQASNATVTLFKGDGFSALCETQSIERIDANSYRLKEACFDQRAGQDYETEAVYTLKGDAAYVMKSDGWEAEARFCPQAQMPEPFNTNDISEFTG